jgi:polyprenyl P-hydroxybenzoate/phenylacrylic acid decarboxylase-like protein
MSDQERPRVIVGMSGSSAPHLGAAFLTLLRDRGAAESHLVLSSGARRSIELELGTDPAEVAQLADVVYDEHDLDAAIGAASFPARAMVIVPCSMRTLALVAAGDDHTLLTRAAAVTLRARRRLVLVTRETPLSYIHLRNMATVAAAGATVAPPIPAFGVSAPSLASMLSGLSEQTFDQIFSPDLPLRPSG